MTADERDDETFDDVSTEELCERIVEEDSPVVKAFALGMSVAEAEDGRMYREGLAAGMARAMEDFSTPTPAPYVAPRFHRSWDLHPASREQKRRRPRMAGVR